MGIETKVILKGKVTPRQVANALKSQLGVEASIDVCEDDIIYPPHVEDVIYLDPKGGKCLNGYIGFTYKSENRKLFYYHTNVLTDLKGRLELALSVDDLDLAGELTQLSLGYGGVAVEVMSALAKHFKGYIDENDCDEYGYRRVK